MSKEKERNTPKEKSIPETFTLIAADLSLKRPGYAAFEVKDNKVISLRTWNIDHKKAPSTTPHGFYLHDIDQDIRKRLKQYEKNLDKHPVYLVREKAIGGPNPDTVMTLNKVVGIIDLATYDILGIEWDQVHPTTAKKIITGSGRAEKSMVADKVKEIIKDVLKIEMVDKLFKCDDESDAAAIGLVWLIQNKIIEVPNDNTVS